MFRRRPAGLVGNWGKSFFDLRFDGCAVLLDGVQKTINLATLGGEAPDLNQTHEPRRLVVVRLVGRPCHVFNYVSIGRSLLALGGALAVCEDVLDWTMSFHCRIPA